MRIWRNRGLNAVCGLTFALAATAHVFSPLAFADDADESVPAGEAAKNQTDFWIGVRCVEVPELLRSQLDLEEGQGVLVDDVVADSPAERAGLKAHDVIATVDGKPMNDPGSLAEAVSSAGDRELKIEYLRGGRKQTLTVKPAPRPESIAPQRQDQRALREWVERLGRGPAPMRFRLWHPGMILPPGASMAPALPDDMTITIEKHGGQPAKVTVKQGDKQWQTGEDALDKLPDEARDYAEHLFGSSGGMFPPGHANPAPHRWPLEQLFGPEGRFDRRLDEMKREIEELRRALEKLPEKPDQP